MRGAPAGRRARGDLRCGGGNGRPPSCDRGAPRYFARFVSDSKSISFSQSERFRSFSEVKPVVGTALRARDVYKRQDHGGADNYLIGNDISGGGLTSYNNNNCNFEKYEGTPLEDDCDTDKRIIELG